MKGQRAIDAALSRLDARVDDAEQRNTHAATGRLAHQVWRDDPVGFVRNVLRGESAKRRTDGTPYQFDILEAIRTHNHVVALSGHGVGKSVLAAWASLWFLTTRSEGLVLVLAPTQQRQARGIVQREVLKWARRGGIELLSDSTALHHTTSGSRLVLLTNAADTGALEGQHADNVLLLCDEAKSIDRETLDGVAGALTGDEGRMVFLSTPGRPSGPLYDAANDQTGLWQTFQIGSDDSDRVSPRWVAGRAQAWGVTSPTYVMRVCGKYPADGEGMLVSWAILYDAAERSSDLPPSSGYRGSVLGIDVARSVAGDASCAALVRNGQVVHLETWREASLTDTASRAYLIAKRFQPDHIIVDAGGVGGGLADRLREAGHIVQDFQFGARAIDSDRFMNRRAEAYWSLRERLESGTISLPREDQLLAELAAQRVMFDSKGRIGIAPKDTIRAELGRSPDRADALAMCCAPIDERFLPFSTAPMIIGSAVYYPENADATELMAWEMGLLDD